MSFIGVLAKLLEVPQIKFAPAKCLKAQFPDYICDKCSKYCPCQAIGAVGQIEVDGEKCDACGLCAGICPGEAFTLEEPSYAQVAVEAREKGKITLTCRKTQSLGAFTVPCLGYLPEILLMGLVLSCHRVRLLYDARRCAGCSRQSGSLLEERLNRIKGLACGLGRPGVLVLEEDEEEEAISRGEFFAFLTTRTKALAHRLPIPGFEEKPREIRKKALPESREIFLEMLAEVPLKLEPVPVSGKDWPFSQVQVHDRCDGCGDCALFCPTGALRVEDRGRGQELLHTGAWCLNCGLCLAKCPRQAISKREVLDLNLMVTGTGIAVKNLEASPCHRCGRPVKVTGNDQERGLCSLCEQEAGHRLQARKMMLNF